MPKGSEVASEETPLLRGERDASTVDQLRVFFRRSAYKKQERSVNHDRRSVRGSLAAPFFPSEIEKAFEESRSQPFDHLEPLDALTPLVAGGVIVSTTGYRTTARPVSAVKSLPAFAPYCRKARHRSFTLWWINEFRHWWKSRYAYTSLIAWLLANVCFSNLTCRFLLH